MKAGTLLTIACAVLTMTMATTAADARPRPQRFEKRFQSNKTFGAGIELGEPTGLTGKYFLSDGGDQAIDFGIGDVYNYFGRSGLHVYGDYLWHPVSLASADAFELPFYVGVGARFWNFDNGPNDNAYAFGIRVPLGIAFDFNNVPLDVFIQVVPVLDFIAHYAPHTVYFDFDVSAGIRYWFT